MYTWQDIWHFRMILHLLMTNLIHFSHMIPRETLTLSKS